MYLFLVKEEPVKEREDFSIFFQDLCWELLRNLDKTQNEELTVEQSLQCSVADDFCLLADRNQKF